MIITLPLQLHAVVLLRVDRATNLRSCLQFGNGPSQLHTPQGKREASFAMSTLSPAIAVAALLKPVLPLAFGVPAAKWC